MVKKVVNIVVTSFAGVLFLFALYIMIFSSIAHRNNNLINIFGYSYSAVPTNSMHGDKKDSFDQGSFVILKMVPYESIKKDDVIVFQYEGKKYIHRVVEDNLDGTLTTRGDNNPLNQTETVTKEIYLAKMISHFKIFNLGMHVSSYQQQMLGLMIIILIIYVMIQVFQLIIMVHKKKLEKIKEEARKNHRKD